DAADQKQDIDRRAQRRPPERVRFEGHHRAITQQDTREELSSPQESAERAAHQRAADRAADRTTNRLAEVGGHAADDLVGYRSGDVAGDQLAGRQPATPDIGAENRRRDVADLADQPSAG